MKKILALALLAAFVSTASAQDQMTKLTRFEGSEITGVIASTNFQVEIIPSASTRAEVELPADAQDKLSFTLDADGAINLKLDGTIKKTDDLHAKVYVKDLKKITASGSSQITFSGPVNVPDLVITLSGGATLEGTITASHRVLIDASGASEVKGKINTRVFNAMLASSAQADLDVQAETASWEMGGASGARVTGHAGSAVINTKTSAKFDSRAYTIGTASLTANTTSGIYVGQIDELSATAGTMSKIRYEGTPKTNGVKASGGSSIKNY